MRNNLFLLFFLIFTSCTTTVFQKKDLKFSDLEKLQIGLTTKADALARFGEPDVVDNGVGDKSDDRIFLLYKGSEGYQRLKLYFSQATGILESVLWTPRENELEAKTSGIFQKYGKDKFKKETLPQVHPHMVMPRYMFKSDDLGITVLNERGDDVEAIAFFTKADRAPATK